MGRNIAGTKSKNIKSNWFRKHFKKASSRSQNREIKKATKKAKENPLTASDLSKCLSRVPNFLGIFPSDQVPLIRFIERPIFIIVNIEINGEAGSHWIALRLGKSKLEIFDSLGFHPRLWSSYPLKFIDWLKNLSLTHRIFVSQLTQEQNTFICGLYCVFFILYRQFLRFCDCCAKFGSDYELNSRKLDRFLLNL